MAYNELIGTLGEQSAAWYKEECRQYAEQAQQSATNAENSATSAERDAGIASDKADIATNKANLAGESADLAQEWAIKTDGKVGGIDYSAKHYAGQASGSAATASNKADEASVSATNAEKWASYTNGTVDGTNYSAKQYALNAGNSATTASTKAGEASDFAQTASDKAGIATTQAGLASGSALSASNSATLAENWATKTDGTVDGTNYSAKKYALNAGNSATNAGTSETNAGNSATLAEKWATLMGDTVDGNEYSAKYYANESATSATNASNSADTAQAYAQTIEDESVKIDTTEKRVSNIEKLLQGNLYDYQTDTDSKYTKTVPTGAMPYAGLESLGGKTVVWNQLNNNDQATQTVQDLTMTNNGDGSWTLNGTASAGGSKWFNRYTDVVSGHKYYICGCPAGGSVNTYSLGFAGVSTDKGNGGVYTYTGATGTINLRFNFATGTSFNNVTIYPKVVDLTLEFGSGNEPTADEFNTMFPNFINSNISYNAGTLLSAGVTEVVSQGRNLLDASQIVQNAISYASPNSVHTDNHISVNPNTTYYLKTISTQGVYVHFYNDSQVESGSVIKKYNSTGFTFTTYADTCYIKIEWYMSTGITPADFVGAEICLSISSSADGTYTPYKAPIQYPIPASIQSLEGYGWSAGSVSNYIDFERKVFVQNVGAVTFDGSNDETWTAHTITNSDGSANLFRSSISDRKGGSIYISGINVVCNGGYVLATNTSTGRLNLTVSGNGSLTAIDFVNNAYADATAWKTALSNNPITVYYPLATPIETDISAYLTDDNLIEVEAGGTLTFENQNGDDYRIDVPSSETFMIDLQSAI